MQDKRVFYRDEKYREKCKEAVLNWSTENGSKIKKHALGVFVSRAHALLLDTLPSILWIESLVDL